MEERRLSTAGESLYVILGVQNTATMEEIRRAYRQQALRYHPDKNPGDPTAAEKFKEVSRAHAILSEPKSRQVYDSYGSMGVYLWEELEQQQVNKLVMEFASSCWCKCMVLLCGLLTCCYFCCFCCCCCCNFCCGTCRPRDAGSMTSATRFTAVAYARPVTKAPAYTTTTTTTTT